MELAQNGCNGDSSFWTWNESLDTCTQGTNQFKSTGDASDFYSEGAWFDSRPEYRLSRERFYQFLGVKVGTEP
jgi:hypothetical protein